MIRRKEIYIYHHLGLGDHITCNAIVRNYAKLYEKVHLFVKDRNLKNVEYLYRDLKNVDFIHGKGDNDEFVDFYFFTHRDINLMSLLVQNNEIERTGKNFDEIFYEKSAIPFDRKYEDCFLLRDPEIEENLCRILNPTGEPYIFVHQDISRGHIMNLDHIKNKNIKIIESSYKLDDIKDNLIFHYMKLIEEAEEIHVMESSFSPMIDHFMKDRPNVFLHKYMRPLCSVRKPFWTIIP